MKSPKRTLLLIALLILAINAWALPKSVGQSFRPPMEKIHEDSAKVVVGMNLSENQQFDNGEHQPPDKLKKVFNDNQQALAELAKKSNRMVIFGLQDESGEYISGLGERRAEKLAQFINDQLLLKDGLPLVETEGLALDNDAKTRVLTSQQQLLNQRSVAIVAYKPMQNQNTIQQMQQKIAALEDQVQENFWWLLIFPLALAFFGWLMWRLFGNPGRQRPAANGGVNPNRPAGNNADNSEDVEYSDDADDSREIPPAFDPSSHESSSGSESADSSGGSEITVNVYGEFHGDQHIHG